MFPGFPESGCWMISEPFRANGLLLRVALPVRGRSYSRWSSTSAALAMAPMRVGLRLTFCRAAKVSLSSAFGHAVHAVDDLVVRGLRLGQLPALRPLERVADRRGEVEVVQVGERRYPLVALARGQSLKQPGRGFRAGGVVFASRANAGDPDREADRVGDDLDVAPWCLCFPLHDRSAPFGPFIATRSVWIRVPSRFRWVTPAALAARIASCTSGAQAASRSIASCSRS
jgi:hypothetical protein